MTYAYRHNSPLAIKIDGILMERRLKAEELRRAIQAELDRRRDEAIKAREAARTAAQNEYDANRRRSFRMFEAACQYFEIVPSLMRSASRTAHVSRSRQIAMFCIYKECWPIESLPRIGRLFAKDHTTVLHAVNRIGELLEAGDEKVVAAVNHLRGVK